MKCGVRVGGTWRNRTLVLIRFQPSSSYSKPVPPYFQQNSNFEFVPEEICWRYGGTGMESEELAWNQNRTRVSVSLCSLYPSTEIYFSSNLPWVQKMTKKSLTLNHRTATEEFKCRPLVCCCCIHANIIYIPALSMLSINMAEIMLDSTFYCFLYELG